MEQKNELIGMTEEECSVWVDCVMDEFYMMDVLEDFDEILEQYIAECLIE